MNLIINILRPIINTAFIAILFFVKRESLDTKKILLIKLEGLGDFIVFLPSLIRYKKIYPGHSLTLLVDNSINYNIAKRYGKDIVDEIITLDAKKFSKDILYRFSMSKMLYKKHFTITINPIYYRRKISDFIVKITNSPERISYKGYEVEKDNKPIIPNLYTNLISIKDSITNEFYRHKDFITQLGYTMDSNYVPTFPLEAEDLTRAKSFLKEDGLQENSYVILFPGAGRDVSRWEPEKFAKIADYIVSKNLDVVILGSKTEMERANIIINNSSKETQKRIFNITNKTDIFLTAGIIKLAKLYVGNDSGPTHLAEAVDQTVVCPLGLGHFMEFFPSRETDKNIIISSEDRSCLNDLYACARDLPKGSPARCVVDITVEQVLDGVKKII